MGFLDFLKKPSPPAPQRPTELDELFGQKDVDIKDVARKLNLAPQEEDLGVPEPTEMLDPYADEQPPAPEVSYEPLVEQELPPPAPEPKAKVPAPSPVAPPVTPAPAITLPDFTDEEIAMLEGLVATAPSPPVSPTSPPQLPEEPLSPGPAPVEEVPEWKERLANVIRAAPQPKEEIAPPSSPAAPAAPAQLMFISATTFFDIRTEISGIRAALREADTSILDAASRHEQTDEKMRRFATEINAVQERLTMIDEALFEE